MSLNSLFDGRLRAEYQRLSSIDSALKNHYGGVFHKYYYGHYWTGLYLCDCENLGIIAIPKRTRIFVHLSDRQHENTIRVSIEIVVTDDITPGMESGS